MYSIIFLMSGEHLMYMTNVEYLFRKVKFSKTRIFICNQQMSLLTVDISCRLPALNLHRLTGMCH